MSIKKHEDSDGGKLPQDMIDQFIQLQLKEVEVKKSEVELKKQQDENNYRYSLEALKVQAEDSKDSRIHFNKNSKMSFWIILFLIAGIIAVIISAMYMNKDELLFEIVKAISLIFGGGATGYMIGYKKQIKNLSQNKPQ